MTTIELIAKINETAGELEAARRAQDWLDAQSRALELAQLFRQLQLEEKSRHDGVACERATFLFKRMRQAVA